jgi:hypothetical protein
MPNTPQDELRHLEQLLAGRGEDDAESFGVALTLDSLARRREQLLEHSAEELHLALKRPGRSTGAEAGFVSDVLRALQNSLASVAQSLTVGATRAGSIPEHIRDAVELRVVAAQPGSLDLRLAPAYPTDQLPLFEEEGAPPLLDASVERVVRVLNLAAGNRQEVLTEVAELGQRAAGHLGELSRALASRQASALIEWNSQRADLTATIDAHAAASLMELLSEVHEEARVVTFSGRLVGGSLIRRVFELEIDEHTVLRGKVAEEASPRSSTSAWATSARPRLRCATCRSVRARRKRHTASSASLRADAGVFFASRRYGVVIAVRNHCRA